MSEHGVDCEDQEPKVAEDHKGGRQNKTKINTVASKYLEKEVVINVRGVFFKMLAHSI